MNSASSFDILLEVAEQDREMLYEQQQQHSWDPAALVMEAATLSSSLDVNETRQEQREAPPADKENDTSHHGASPMQMASTITMSRHQHRPQQQQSPHLMMMQDMTTKALFRVASPFSRCQSPSPRPSSSSRSRPYSSSSGGTTMIMTSAAAATTTTTTTTTATTTPLAVKPHNLWDDYDNDDVEMELTLPAYPVVSLDGAAAASSLWKSPQQCSSPGDSSSSGSGSGGCRTFVVNPMAQVLMNMMEPPPPSQQQQYYHSTITTPEQPQQQQYRRPWPVRPPHHAVAPQQQPPPPAAATTTTRHPW